MKMSDIQEIGRRIEDGEWVDNTGLAGLRLKVRGLRSRAFERMQVDLIQKKTGRSGRRLSPEETTAITNACLRDAVLLDWEGLTGDDDRPIPYDRATAEMLLTDPHFAAFREAVVFAADVVGDLGRSE